MKWNQPVCVVSYSRYTGEVRFLTPFNNINLVKAYADVDCSPTLAAALDSAVAFGGFVSLCLEDVYGHCEVVSCSRMVF